MALKKTVTAETLVRLGAERLAGILVQLAGEQPAIKRRLRLELAGEAGGEIVAAEIGRRITVLRSAHSFIDWQKRPDFVRDLDLTRATIADRVAETRPDLALDLMWRFMALAEPVINRVDDSSGSVGDVFRAACEDLGAIAAKARPDPQALGDRVFTAVTNNEYGEFDRLVPVIFPALGAVGVASLKARLLAALPKRPAKDRYDHHAAAVRRALQDLADGEGDVDGYIALVPSEDRKRSAVAAGIGQRLLIAGRAEEAILALEVAAPERKAQRSGLEDDRYGLGWHGRSADWESVYLDALDATGQAEHAQRLRRTAFEERLSVERLRAYLNALPDFEDVLAEERAMEHALGFRSFSTALHFLHTWPAQKPLRPACRAPVSSTVIQEAVCSPARSTSRLSARKPSWRSISSRTTWRLEMLRPSARSCAVSRSTVTWPWWCCSSTKRRRFRPEMASDTRRQRRHYRAAVRRYPAFPPITDRLGTQHQVLDDEGVVWRDHGNGDARRLDQRSRARLSQPAATR